MSIELRPHQIEAIDFALAQSRRATIWNAYMGTGKTRMGLGLLERLDSRLTLVVAPLAVVIGETWQREVQKIGAAGSVFFCSPTRGTVAKKAEYIAAEVARARLAGRPLIVVVHWDIIWREPLKTLLRQTRWGAMFFDEIHFGKSHDGKASKAAADITRATAAPRVGLTGTLMPHGPLDVFGEMRIINPAVFGLSFVRFRATYAKIDSRGGFPKVTGYQNLDHLAASLRSTVFYVDRSVLRLPPAIDETLPVVLEPATRRLYDDVERGLIVEIEGGVIDSANGMVRLLRLQQITGGCGVAESDYQLGARVNVTVGTEKRDVLREFLEGLPADEPVVVFYRFSYDAAQIHEVARELGRASLELSGARKEHLQFQQGEGTIIAVQNRAGAAGIDLTRARYCVFYSLGFSLGDYMQARSRVHRPGQERTVWYYHLVAKETADESVYATMTRKKDTIRVVEDELQRDVAGDSVVPELIDYLRARSSRAASTPSEETTLQ